MKRFTFLKSFTLSMLLLLAWSGWGQTPFTATYTFGGDGNVQSFAYNGTSYDGIIPGNIVKVGVTTSSSSGNFRANDWPLGATNGSDIFTGSVDLGKYIGFTIEAATGYKFTVSSITFGIGRSATGTRQSQWRGSSDSYGSILNNYTTLNVNLSNDAGVLTNPDINSSWLGNVLTLGSEYEDITESVGFRYYLYNSEAIGGTAGLQGPITIEGTFEPAGENIPPSISNIVQVPSDIVTSNNTVSVSADVTDSDGTVEVVELRWGTATGVYPNFISMSLDAGDTYTTNTDIPTQPDGTTVYYIIYAEDDEEDFSVTMEQSYTVFDPPGLPYTENFSGFNSFANLPEAWSVSNSVYAGDWGTGTGAGLRGNAGVLGFQHTGTTGVFTATLYLLNNTGTTIEELFISYMGMVERVGEARSPEWTVELNGVEVPALFYSTDNGVDVLVSALVEGLNISDNDIFTISWSSDRGFNASGSSKQIGIADVNVAVANPFVMIGAADDASNYDTWSDNDNQGYGFEPWGLTTGTDGGFAGFFLGNPADAGITGMDNPSFAMFANPQGDNFATADRNFISPLGFGSTFSVDWGVNWDSDGSGNKGLNLYTGGTSGTEIININMGGSSAITINGNPMFNNYGTLAMTLNFEYVSEGQLRVYGMGRDGSESYDQTLSVAGAPDAVRFYASGLAAGDNRQPYFNNLKIETDPSVIPVDASVSIKGQVALNADLEIENLFIEEGNFLQINNEASLTVNGILTNDEGLDGLVIKNGGSLIHNTANVPATMLRQIPSNGWHMVSAPVSGMVILGSDFAPTPTGDPLVLPTNFDFYFFDESEDELPWINLRAIDNAVNPSFDATFLEGKGYLVAYAESYPDGPFAFEGTLNTGVVNIPLSFSGTKNDWEYVPGWNLIGNPYPSGIDWGAVNKTSLADDFAYVYDHLEDDYAPQEEGTIAANQGFFVKVISAGSLPLDNTVRVHGGTFTKENTIPDMLELQLANAGYSSKTTIRIHEGSEFTRDRKDALKMFSFAAHMPQIYSYTSDQVRVAINSIPEIVENTVIPMGMLIPVAGEYNISLSSLEGEFINQVVYLEDLFNGNIHNLTEGPYTFTASPDDDSNRFLLKFGALSIPELPGSSQLQAYAYNNVLYIMNATDTKAQVEVYNVQGQVVMSREIDKGLQNMPLKVAPGTYIVRMTTQGETAARKVVIQ